MSVIVVVGMACRYPDAASPEQLWENVLAQRRAFRRWPDERLRRADYHSEDRSDPDRTYCTQAAVIEGYVFDRARFRVVGSTYRAVDPVHWLALDVATEALASAGFRDGAELPRDTTGVLVGNSLTGEFSRANILRLRWPYVRRTVEAELIEAGWDDDRRAAFLVTLEERYKAPFPEVGEESLAGGLSNTIAGRICNHFDLHGGGFTIDAACASSLLAIAQSCSALAAGDLDVALAGGVDLSLDPFEIIGFSRLGALASDDMRVFDERSAGFWPGEGCGFVVLMREEDARRARRPILARIRGWGISSDGSGGITRPEVEGQLLAVRRAWRRAGLGANDAVYVEGHGTGTEVGDRTELTVLRRALAEADAKSPVVVGSVKANIGHTKAAAGVAGFLKVVQALRHGIVPPNTGCERPHPELAPGRLEVRRSGEAWPAGRPLVAASSSMGFGGINVHVVVEGEGARAPRELTGAERTLLRSPQDGELLLLSAGSAEELQASIESLRARVPLLSRAELGDLAAYLAGRADPSAAVRGAVVAATAEAADERLARLHEEAGGTGASRHGTTDRGDGVFLGSGPPAARLGFLFPGQGTPVNPGGGLHARRFDRAWEVARDTACGPDAGNVDTRFAQPAIVAASVATLRVLRELGIAPDVVSGHSLGELTALHCAGVLDEESLLAVAKARGAAMADLPGDHGAMAGVAASPEEVEGVIAGTSLVIAGRNAPRRTVVAGESAAIDAFVETANAKGWRASRLPVSHAFHSPLVADAAPVLSDALDGVTLRPPRIDVASTITGARLAPDEDVGALLVRQVTDAVRFTDAVAAAGDVDAWIEVGPGSVLSALVGAQGEGAAAAHPTEGGADSLRALLHAVGAAWALGRVARPDALFRDRFVRPFDPERAPVFFANPCEEAPPLDAAPDAPRSRTRAAATVAPDPDASIPEIVRRLVAERTELPVSLVEDGHRMLGDLHLNSIAVAQLVNDAARLAGRTPPSSPTDYANASVAEIAEALERLEGAARKRRGAPAGVGSWVRAFAVDWRERALPGADPAPPGEWRVDDPAGHAPGGLPAALHGIAGGGTVVVLGERPDERDLARLVRAGQAAMTAAGRGERFVVAQRDGGGSALARTLQLEAPHLVVRVVEVPFGDPRAAMWIAAEAAAGGGYREVRYEADGRRLEPEMRVLPSRAAAPVAPLGPGDVLLVTGGGKGITAECALDLARAYGARVALLGRSRPEDDAVLAANLDRFRDGGVAFTYVPVDVARAADVREAVARVERELGGVTAILHGAGRNEPRLIPSVDEASLRATFAPKVDGLDHLLAAVDADRVRLLVAFGSIISRLGLAGEADYAVANEWMTRRVRAHARAHPGCRCLVADWSVWSGVGMGERLGTLESLAAAGVTPIPPEAGVAFLRWLLEAEPATLDVIVAGRFGTPPTAPLPPVSLPFARFLETVRVHTPGVELVVDAVVSPRTDPYLDDHVFRGDRVFPAVLALEMMAQAVAALAGGETVAAFERVEFRAPLVVPPDGALVVRCAALARDDGRTDLVLRSSGTDFHTDHFLATATTARIPAAAEAEGEHPPGPGELSLDPARHLYGGLLFHGGRFRRIARYLDLGARRCVAEITPNGTSAWFDRTLPDLLLLGDPSVRDAALHAIQACVPHATILPVGADRIEIRHGESAAGARYVRARERARDGRVFTYDLEIVDERGRCLERWTGLRLAIVAEDFAGPWAPELLGPYLERRLGEWAGDGAVDVALAASAEEGTPEEPERAERRGRALARLLGRDVRLAHAPNGRPEVVGDPARSVSVAHAARATIAVTGPAAAGCDLEVVAGRTASEWEGLLGSDRMRLAREIATGGDPADVAATRVWCAAECLRKAGIPVDAPLTVGARTDDGWMLLHSGATVTATIPVRLAGRDEPVVVAVAWGDGTPRNGDR